MYFIIGENTSIWGDMWIPQKVVITLAKHMGVIIIIDGHLMISS